MQILACLSERRARVRLHRALGSDYAIAWAADWDQLEQLTRTMAIDVFVLDPRQSSGRVDVAAVCRVRERYPSIPAIIYTRFHPDLAVPLLTWGETGVCGAAFLDQSDGEWDFQRLLHLALARSGAQEILAALKNELGELSEEVNRVLGIGLYEATRLRTAQEWALRAGVPRASFYRLFEGARLPSPKTCLQWLRLFYAAKALSDPGVSVEDVVYRMRYSAPPNFWVHVRKMLGIKPSEMRWSLTTEDLVGRFADVCRARASERLTDDVG